MTSAIIKNCPSGLPSRGTYDDNLLLSSGLQSDDSRNSSLSQLSESNELTSKFLPKKITNLLLADSYKRLDFDSKSIRVRECGTLLEFAHEISSDGVLSSQGKLYNANFCRDRLCPMCAWRRSYKIFGQVSAIMNFISSDFQFLFLTLTVPNCEGDNLPVLLDSMFKGWSRLIRYKAFKTAVKGFFRVLEVTRNFSTGTYHPHFHVVLAVDPSYFHHSSYIKRDDWLFMWQRAMRDFSITQVDVRRVRSKSGSVSSSDLTSAVAEIAKYSVKSSHYLFPNDCRLTDKVVFTLSGALASRRLCQFGGIFAEIQKQLNMDDCEDGDLIHIDDDSIRPDLAFLICRYGWSSGVYKMSDVFIKLSADM